MRVSWTVVPISSEPGSVMPAKEVWGWSWSPWRRHAVPIMAVRWWTSHHHWVWGWAVLDWCEIESMGLATRVGGRRRGRTVMLVMIHVPMRDAETMFILLVMEGSCS